MGDSFLFDADSWRQTSYLLHFCLLRHTTDKHTSIRRERFEIPSLTFITESGKCKRGFTRSTHPREDSERVFGKRDVDITEIVGRYSEKINGIGHRKAIRQYTKSLLFLKFFISLFFH